MPNNRPGWGAFLPRYNIPETFGTAISYEAQLHWFLKNWDEVAEYANALEQPTVDAGTLTLVDSNTAAPAVTNVGTDINAVFDFSLPMVRVRLADPLLWDQSLAYDVLTMVTDNDGNSYTSVSAVPPGVSLDNRQYWARTGNYDAALVSLQDEIDYVEGAACRCYASASDMVADLKAIEGTICRTLGRYAQGDGGGAWYVVGLGESGNGFDRLTMDNGNTAVLVTVGDMNVRQYGAHGDGLTDDYQPFATACSRLGNRTVNVPAGTYFIKDNLTIDGVTLKGDAQFATVLKFDTGHGLVLAGRYSQVDSMRLVQDSGDGTEKGVSLVGGAQTSHRNSIRNMMIDNFGYGIYCDSLCWDLIVENVRINNSEHGIYFTVTSPSSFNLNFTNVYCNACTAPLYMSNVFASFNCCNFGLTATKAVVIRAHAHCVFTSCNFEADSEITSESTDYVILNTSAGMTFIDCSLWDYSAPSGNVYFVGFNGSPDHAEFIGGRFTSKSGDTRQHFFNQTNVNSLPFDRQPTVNGMEYLWSTLFLTTGTNVVLPDLNKNFRYYADTAMHDIVADVIGTNMSFKMFYAFRCTHSGMSYTGLCMATKWQYLSGSARVFVFSPDGTFTSVLVS